MDEHYDPDTRSTTEEVLVNFDEDNCLPAADEVRRLVEGSPLGTAGARAVRNRIPREHAESVVAQWRTRRAAEHQIDSNEDDQADLPAAAADRDVSAPATSTTNVVRVEKLSESQLQALEHSFFGRPLGEILDFEDESRDRRRQEILTDVAARIEEVTGVAANQVVREAAFVTDLGFDSITAIELGMEIEGMYGIRIDADDLVELQTVGDVVDFIEEKAWRQGHLCALNGGAPAPPSPPLTADKLVGYLRGFGTSRIVEIDEAESFDLKVGNDRWIMRIRVGLVVETPEKTIPEKSHNKRLAKERLKLRHFEAMAKDMFDRREYETRVVQEIMEDLTSFPPEMTRKACAVLVEQADQRDEWYWEVEQVARQPGTINCRTAGNAAPRPTSTLGAPPPLAHGKYQDR